MLLEALDLSQLAKKIPRDRAGALPQTSGRNHGDTRIIRRSIRANAAVIVNLMNRITQSGLSAVIVWKVLKCGYNPSSIGPAVKSLPASFPDHNVLCPKSPRV
jgi:hypothetical protein